MIRGRTGADGSLDFFSEDAPNTVVGSVTADGITGASGGAVTAADITDATAVGRDVLTAVNAAAGRTAIGAGTSSLALGTTAGTALVGNDSRLTAGAAGTATVRALGTTGTTAAAGNDVRLLTGTAAAVNNSTATDVAGLVADFNALLAALRARGVITGA